MECVLLQYCGTVPSCSFKVIAKLVTNMEPLTTEQLLGSLTFIWLNFFHSNEALKLNIQNGDQSINILTV